LREQVVFYNKDYELQIFTDIRIFWSTTSCMSWQLASPTANF
jgi:hypothetical protein